MQSDYREPLNLGTDEVVSINELAVHVIELSGKRGITVRHVDGPQGIRGRNSFAVEILQRPPVVQAPGELK
jgi:GDP-D-mannose 3', 5'-epimerase